ncbi:MAG: di-trans,poly-cis-decaprenylcistransferase [Verrucomicrobia bacterium RIFCSPHIGHO2_12_FULL_41_10]|nr:MAG: di-trans,poly-cis-decaprenylcistransferase [Verrucomicrobia bacterium RIFCSPHIGHO2_12_FULL_41_10]HLB33115.1 isoprenyl transferase [Chthoniobacterales bacterium]
MIFTTPALGSPHPPRHIAIIMDGNGRWAKERGWPRIKGHEQGSQSVRECLNACLEVGVEYLTLYAFSSENWKRPAIEVQGLMVLLEHYLTNKIAEMNGNGVRFNAIGRLEKLPEAVRRRLQKTISETAHNTKLTLTLALNYGGRDEIVDAVKTIAHQAVRGKIDPEAITEEIVAQNLYTADMPDPDLLVRTSGEHRLSNFLLWQLSYTEIYVTSKLWPDFNKEDLLVAIEDYQRRDRRFGGR